MSKHYGAVEALSEVSIEVRQGEIVALAGDNGAGKSTLMKIISGAEAPSAGNVEIYGHSIARNSVSDARKQGIEMVYQDLALCENLPVADNIFLGRELKRQILPGFGLLARRKMLERAETLLQTMDVHLKSLHEPVSSLSGGQRQAVAISRALSFAPQLVLFDEPTAALSVSAVPPVLELIRRVPERGASALIVSHRLSDIMTVSDRVYVMRNGRIVANMRTADVDASEIVNLMAGVKELSAEVKRGIDD